MGTPFCCLVVMDADARNWSTAQIPCRRSYDGEMSPSAENSSDPVGAQPSTDQPLRGSFAAAVLRGGEEPDARFTMANERTFLAWIRTSLALLAGGIAIEAFTLDVFKPEVRAPLAVFLLVLAMGVALGAAFRWLKIERAMRQKKPLPMPALVPVLAAGAMLVAGVVAFTFLR